MQHVCKHLVIAGGLLLLAACGGGGGGAGMTGGGIDVTETQLANPAAAHAAGGDAAKNLPNFGSVTQSSNAGSIAGTTGDAASTAFDGNNVRVTVERTDGSRLVLDGTNDRIDRETFNFEGDILPGYSSQRDVLLGATGNSVYLGAVSTHWNRSDSEEYLALGYWLSLEGTIDPLNITGAEVGAFVDGPELSGTPTLPNSGTATYTGDAAGFYAYVYGNNWPTVASGTTDIGEFHGHATFTANFGAGEISGCVGCNGEVTVSGVYVTPSGDVGNFADQPVPIRVRLGAAPFGSNGEFRNRDVTVEITGRTVTETNGSWGGKFSNVLVADQPRLVAGTGGAEWRESDGSEGAFIGAWGGIKE